MAPKESNVRTQREILRNVEDKLDKLIGNLHGDKEAGVDGYFKRVQDLEDSEKYRGKIYIFISTISAGITVGLIKLIGLFK